MNPIFFCGAAAIAILAGSLSSCGISIHTAKDIKTYPVKVANFTSISSLGPVDISFTQAPEYSVSIHCIPEFRDRIKIATKGDDLVVSFEEMEAIKLSAPMTLEVSAPDLTYIQSLGSADIKVEGKINTESFTISSAGSGDITIDEIACNSLSISSKGSGDLSAVSLTSPLITLSTAGSGDIHVKNLVADSLSLYSAGSGDVSLTNVRCNSVSGRATGSGDITIGGEAGHTDLSASGSSDINSGALRQLSSPVIF